MNFNRGTPEERTARALVPRLLAWYRQNARNLPWRRTRDPYAIWISEVMLQQTQVKTVIPFWERWMRELPTVWSLARARTEKILKLWEGLGYYTRARNLQRAARVIVAEHGAVFPRAFDEVLALPGIGRYTAGAICSIGFDQPTPILDGNVIRILARLFGISKNPDKKETNAMFWGLAEFLVHEADRKRQSKEQNCSHLNQALMELGALVCTPRNPKCRSCPVRRHCVALRENRVTELPNRGKRVASVERRFAAFVVERRGRFLIRQRPAGVVNARLWEFPNVEVNGQRLSPARLAEDLFGKCRCFFQPTREIRHNITRYRITLSVFHAQFSGGTGGTFPKGRWCSLPELRKLPFPSAHRKILNSLSLGRVAP